MAGVSSLLVAFCCHCLFIGVIPFITDSEMYRRSVKVSFPFRGSLYRVNDSMTLFVEIEVSR